MKKGIAFLLAMAMTTSLVSTTVQAKDENKGYLYQLIYEKNMGLINEKVDSPKVSWDKVNQTPRFISGKLSKTKVLNETDVKKYLKENMDAFKLSHGDFKLISKEKDSLGYSHYKFQYVVEGIDVFGSQVMVHTTSNGMIYSVNGQFQSAVPKKSYNKEIKLNLKDAVNSVEKNVDKKFAQNKNSIYIYNVNNKWTPVYKLELWNEDEVETWMAVVDATNGSVIKVLKEGENVADTATGIGIRGDVKTLEVDNRNNTYYLENLSNKGRLATYDAKNAQVIPGTLVSSPTKTFNEPVQAAAVDAHHYIDKVYKYYKNVHQRESYDNNAGGMQLVVHYGKNYLNAYYNRRTALVFGDGDNRYAKDFAKALDIIAHEFTHAVTDKTAKLEYENQSGALNESFSDVFGILIEDRDWTIGEDIVLPNAPVKLMRSMENPTLYNQPAHMKDYKNLPNTQQGDWGGVHTNSGIPNKAFYNVAQAIGKEKAGKIYYRALTSYLHAFSNFQDARDALETTAKELYSDAEKLEVSKAFYAVGIGNAPEETTLSLKAANVSVDKTTNTGSYTLSIALDGKNLAKTVRVIENGTTEVLNQAVNVETTGRTLTKAFTNKAVGKYTYVVEVSDGTNNLTSQIEVTVEKTTPSEKLWKVNTLYNPGDIVNYNGTLYKCLRAHYSNSAHTPEVLLPLGFWTKL